MNLQITPAAGALAHVFPDKLASNWHTALKYSPCVDVDLGDLSLLVREIFVRQESSADFNFLLSRTLSMLDFHYDM